MEVHYYQGVTYSNELHAIISCIQGLKIMSLIKCHLIREACNIFAIRFSSYAFFQFTYHCWNYLLKGKSSNLCSMPVFAHFLFFKMQMVCDLKALIDTFLWVKRNDCMQIFTVYIIHLVYTFTYRIKCTMYYMIENDVCGAIYLTTPQHFVALLPVVWGVHAVREISSECSLPWKLG